MIIAKDNSNVNYDTFLFSIQQAFTARSREEGEFNSHLRYEPFLLKTWSRPKNFNFSEFRRQLMQIITHHHNAIPNYKRKENVSLDNIHWFSQSIATLMADTQQLFTEFTGLKSLPLLDAEQPFPQDKISPQLTLLIEQQDAKHQIASKEDSEETASISDATSDLKVVGKEFWSLYASCLRKIFGNRHTELILKYVSWNYADKSSKEASAEPKTNEVDWNVRPPCGEIYSSTFKHLFDRKGSYSARDSNAPSREFSGAFAGDAKKSFWGDKKNSDRPSKKEDAEPRFERKKFRDKPSYQKDKSFKQQLKPFDTQKSIEEALVEVQQAIEKMKTNPEIKEYSLQPQNSFVRREQHSVISEAGYLTESRGEADTRHVCIIRVEN